MNYIQIIPCMLSLMNLSFTDAATDIITWQYDFKYVVQNNPRIEESLTSLGKEVFTFTNQVNDKISWDFAGVTHNLIEVFSQDAWLACDFVSDGTVIIAQNNVGQTKEFNEVGMRYFMCTVVGQGSHCQDFDQKLVVRTVAPSTDSPTDSPTDSLFPTDSPSVADCSSLDKKTCKRNNKKGGRCEYVSVKFCKLKKKKGKKYKKACKKFNDYNSLIDFDKRGCRNEKVNNVGKICEPKKKKTVVLIRELPRQQDISNSWFHKIELVKVLFNFG